MVTISIKKKIYGNVLNQQAYQRYAQQQAELAQQRYLTASQRLSQERQQSLMQRERQFKERGKLAQRLSGELGRTVRGQYLEKQKKGIIKEYGARSEQLYSQSQQELEASLEAGKSQYSTRQVIGYRRVRKVMGKNIYER